MNPALEWYRGKNVLVTGGLGFLGSNLALRLSQADARVTVVDSCVAGCGADDRNLASAAGRIHLVLSDIGELEAHPQHLRGMDVVFNLAGEISHRNSMLNPRRDLQLNTVAQLKFLCALARCNPGVRIVYAGTRQVYGRPQYLPVDESHPVDPVDFNGVHKYAATMYHLLLARNGLLDAVILRLTNVYGPRMALFVEDQGFLSAFLRRFLTGQDVEIFGDGTQLRDPLYVDDAVDAFLAAGSVGEVHSRSFNIGGPEALSVDEIARIMQALTGGGASVRRRPFPADARSYDIGSYVTDSSRAKRELDWSAGTLFADGMRETIAFYRRHWQRYGLQIMETCAVSGSA